MSCPVTPAVLFKAFIVLLLLAILVSLALGLIFMVNDDKESNRMVTSLSFRVALSILLFITLFVGYSLGLIKPHGIFPVQTERAPPSAAPPEEPTRLAE